MSQNNSEYISNNRHKGFLSMLLHQWFHNEPKNKEELLSLIRTLQKHKLLDLDTQSMLEGVININKKRIKEIMIPRPQMVTLSFNYTLDQCLKVIIKAAHSRYPVMSENKNYVKGFLIAKDLLPFMFDKSTNFCIENILRPVIVVPESKYVHSMLKEFRLKRYHMAIVIDEFGVVSGLVTIEDILELIVGDIEDEYDSTNELNIREIDKNIFTIKGLTEIEEFNQFFDTSFNDTEVDTIGGFIMKAFGKLPKCGETIFINKYKFKILATDSRRILQLETILPKKN